MTVSVVPVSKCVKSGCRDFEVKNIQEADLISVICTWRAAHGIRHMTESCADHICTRQTWWVIIWKDYTALSAVIDVASTKEK